MKPQVLPILLQFPINATPAPLNNLPNPDTIPFIQPIEDTATVNEKFFEMLEGQELISAGKSVAHWDFSEAEESDCEISGPRKK